MINKNNTNLISQFSITNATIDTLENILNQETEIKVGSNKVTEPKNSNLADSIYGDLIVKNHKTKDSIIEINDHTEGIVRKIIIHPSGTYQQINEKGEPIEKIIESKYEIILKDKNIAIDNDKIEVISNDNKVSIGNNSIIEIENNKDETIKNNMTINVKGNTEINSTGPLKLHSDSKIQISAPDTASTWAPNCMKVCPITGAPHTLTATLKP